MQHKHDMETGLVMSEHHIDILYFFFIIIIFVCVSGLDLFKGQLVWSRGINVVSTCRNIRAEVHAIYMRFVSGIQFVGCGKILIRLFSRQEPSQTSKNQTKPTDEEKKNM